MDDQQTTGEMPATGDVTGDDFAIRIFSLADHAEAIPSNGKLYINGAGVGTVFLPSFPGVLPPISLAVRIRIPWNRTTEPFSLRVRLLTPDHAPVGQDPLVDVNPEVGRPPGLRPGDEIGLNLAFGLGGFPIPAEGTVHFHLEIDGREFGQLPLKVARLPTITIAP